jgi:hypothetical protein
VNLNPRTRPVEVEKLRVGHIVMESDEHPAVITRITTPAGKVFIRARYVWQDKTEPDWPLGTYPRGRRLRKALEK